MKMPPKRNAPVSQDTRGRTKRVEFKSSIPVASTPTPMKKSCSNEFAPPQLQRQHCEFLSQCLNLLEALLERS